MGQSEKLEKKIYRERQRVREREGEKKRERERERDHLELEIFDLKSRLSAMLSAVFLLLLVKVCEIGGTLLSNIKDVIEPTKTTKESWIHMCLP